MDRRRCCRRRPLSRGRGSSDFRRVRPRRGSSCRRAELPAGYNRRPGSARRRRQRGRGASAFGIFAKRGGGRNLEHGLARTNTVTSRTTARTTRKTRQRTNVLVLVRVVSVQCPCSSVLACQSTF